MSVSPTFGPRHTAALRDRMSQDGRSPLWGYRCAVLSVTLLVALIAAYILASRVNDAEARGDLARRARHRHRKLLFSPVYPVSPFFLPWRPRDPESWRSWQPRVLEFDVNGGDVVGELTARRSGYTGLAVTADASLNVADKIRDERFPNEGGHEYAYEYYDDQTGEWVPAEDEEDDDDQEVKMVEETQGGAARFGEAGAGFGAAGTEGRASGLENLGAGFGAVGGTLGR